MLMMMMKMKMMLMMMVLMRMQEDKMLRNWKVDDGIHTLTETDSWNEEEKKRYMS